MTMNSDDKGSVKSSKLDDLIDNLISDEELKRYIAEQNDGLTREEREKIKRENRINAINQWCAENPSIVAPHKTNNNQINEKKHYGCDH